MYISVQARQVVSAQWPHMANAYCTGQPSYRARLGPGCCSHVFTRGHKRERVVDAGANLKQPSGGLLGGGVGREWVWVTNRKCREGQSR